MNQHEHFRVVFNVDLVPDFLKIVRELMATRRLIEPKSNDYYALNVYGHEFSIRIMSGFTTMINAKPHVKGSPYYSINMHGRGELVYCPTWTMHANFPVADAATDKFLRDTAFYFEYSPEKDLICDDAVNTMFKANLGIDLKWWTRK